MFCFFLSWLLLVLLVLFLSCCVSCLLSLLAGVLFYAANESFSPRFCSASFFLFFPIRERNTSVYICAWYFLRCLTLNSTIMKRLLVILFCFSSHLCADICHSVKLWRYTLTWNEQTCMIHRSYVINDEEIEVWQCCTPLITFALFLCTGEMTVHVQMLNKQRRHSYSDREKAVLNGWPSGFLILHSPHFS